MELILGSGVKRQEFANSVCRSVEHHLQSVEEVRDLTVKIELRDNFEGLPEALDDPDLARNPAAYRHSEGAIHLNNAVFSGLDEEVAESALAHEIGEAAESHGVFANESGLFALLPRDTKADWLACKAGYCDALGESRSREYGPIRGPKYREILQSWPNKEEFAGRMMNWLAVGDRPGV